VGAQAAGSAPPHRQVKSVLHLIDQGGPGGAQTVFVDLATRMDRSRWRPIAAVPGAGWVADALTARGIQPVVTPIRHGPFDPRYLLQLISMIRRERVDLVHAHLLGPSVYGGLAGIACGVPVISTFHGHVDVAPDERFRGLKFRIIGRAAGAVVFVSERLRQFFLSVTPLDPGCTAVIHNGVDLSAFRPDAARPFRREMGVGSDEFLVGAVGHIRPPKAYDVFIRAAAQLRRVSASFRFVIVGLPEGTLLSDLTRLRDELGLRDAVTFAGFREDIQRVMAALDVYVISSSTEGFSLSAVQAMACGVPVVATRCGGPEEIVTDGATGLLVEVADPGAIARAVAALWEAPDLRRRLALSGQGSVRQRFSQERMIGAYDELYGRCIQDSSGLPGPR